METSIREIVDEQILPSDRRGLLELCTTKNNEGCTHVASGHGIYVNPGALKDDPVFQEVFASNLPQEVRIVGILAFYKQNKVETCEFSKIHVSGISMHLGIFEGTYTPEQFEEHARKYRIAMSEKVSLDNLEF